MVGLIERTLETPRGPAGWPVRREWARLYARSTRRTVPILADDDETSDLVVERRAWGLRGGRANGNREDFVSS